MAKKHKIKAGGKAIGKGLMSAAGFLAKRSAVYGVGAQIVEEYLEEHWDYAKEHWYAAPLATLALAASNAVIKNEAGRKGLAGAAGYSAALRYKVYQFQNGKRDTSPLHNMNYAPKADGAAGKPGAQGYDDDAGLRQDAGLFN
jgi:hypothetical protein